MSEGQAPLDRSMWSVTPDGPIVGAEPCQPSATQDSDPGDWGHRENGCRRTASLSPQNRKA